MITPGILENIRLLSVNVNDKGTLVLTWQQDTGGSGDLLDMLSSTSSTASDSDSEVYIWPVKEDDRVTSDAEKFKSAMNSLKSLRASLNHMLEQYTTTDKIKWDVLHNLGIVDGKELESGLMDSVKRPIILLGLYNNYATQFKAQIDTFAGLSSPLFRMKFLRASKEKSFPTLPKFAPFMEPMTIQKTASKLAFSKYELGYRTGDGDGKPSGLNLSDPTPATGAGAAAGKGNAKEAADVANLFGLPVSN